MVSGSNECASRTGSERSERLAETLTISPGGGTEILRQYHTRYIQDRQEYQKSLVDGLTSNALKCRPTWLQDLHRTRHPSTSIVF
jgi:hypothetical protein